MWAFGKLCPCKSSHPSLAICKITHLCSIRNHILLLDIVLNLPALLTQVCYQHTHTHTHVHSPTHAHTLTVDCQKPIQSLSLSFTVGTAPGSLPLSAALLRHNWLSGLPSLWSTYNFASRWWASSWLLSKLWSFSHNAKLVRGVTQTLMLFTHIWHASISFERCARWLKLFECCC